MDEVRSRETKYPFRMGEDFEVVDTNTNSQVKRSVNIYAKSVFKDPSIAIQLSELHDKYAVLPADKATKLFLFVNHIT